MSILCLSMLPFTLAGQKPAKTIRTIEVSGEAELVLDPEEIIFQIAFEEYWKEEFEGKKWEEYQNKIDIDSIERALISELLVNDIKMGDITLVQTGNYWRQRGKDFLMSKTIEVRLDNFEMANRLSNNIKTRGIKNMYISQLKREDMSEKVLETKIMALKDARNKAYKLLASLGEKLGKPIYITESERQYPSPVQKEYAMTRSALTADQAAVNYENFKKIILRSSVGVVFEIAEH